ncbi:4'-phosphopantetheinyl transferase superfamily protein [Acinetobacter calcoaceticus]|uniref:4'-phosphopantetheinyl transferase family protein n=1 Tax=Acinetobacter calcoaceticus TaxID=471 RepID=UPI0032B3BCE0
MELDSTNYFIKKIYQQNIIGLPGICIQIEFLYKYYNDDITLKLLGNHLPESLKNVAIKRKSEYTAGRYAVKQALRLLDHTMDKEIGIGQNGIPLWPQLFTGSISHTSTNAMCVVSHTDEIRSIGIDIENWFNNDLFNSVASSVLTSSEYKFLNQYKSLELNIVTLIFSAKESLFKALYFEVKYYFGFDAAKIVLIDFQKNIFIAELILDLNSNLKKGRQFKGIFKFYKNFVFTAITIYDL